jgi:hypothetical protein
MNAPQSSSQFFLSPLHAAVSHIQRAFDAAPLNLIVNHPEVLPHVGGAGTGPMDLTPFVQDSSNIALMCDGAAGLFNALAPGIYELHSMAIPERRGAHVMAVAAACFHLMFTRTAAIEIITRIPPGNAPALAAARKAGFKLEFTTPHGWITPEGSLPVAWYRLGIIEWMAAAPGLVERGRWFHEAVVEACKRANVTRAPHPDDDTHNRYAGMACEMVLGGQVVKAIHFLNRISAITRAPPLVLLSRDRSASFPPIAP